MEKCVYCVQEDAEFIQTLPVFLAVSHVIRHITYFPLRNSQGYHSNGKSMQPVPYTCLLPVGSAKENRKQRSYTFRRVSKATVKSHY